MAVSTGAALRGLMTCALITAGMTATPASALLNQSWNGWRWARSGNLFIQLGDNVSSNWDPYLRTAAQQWSADPIIDFRVAAGRSDPVACRAVYGTVQACSSNYGATGWLGWAQVWTSGGYIVQATVKLNDYYFSQPRYNNATYRSMTACHELGHVIGLNHPDVNFTNANLGSCLDYTNDPSGLLGTNGTLANTAPGGIDFAALRTIYAVPGGNQIRTTMITGTAGSPLPSVPEPATWALMIGGFALTGFAARRRRRDSRVTFA